MSTASTGPNAEAGTTGPEVLVRWPWSPGSSNVGSITKRRPAISMTVVGPPSTVKPRRCLRWSTAFTSDAPSGLWNLVGQNVDIPHSIPVRRPESLIHYRQGRFDAYIIVVNIGR